MEIDELKQVKQDKVICEQPLKEIVFLKEHKVDRLVCEKIEAVACRDREEIKDGLKEGIQEFKSIHKKIDRIMWKMKLSPEDSNNGD